MTEGDVPVCKITTPHTHSSMDDPIDCPWHFPETVDVFLGGLKEARKIVARQTDLTELVHFERPSDFRKGVLTCLAALDNEISRLEKS